MWTTRSKSKQSTPTPTLASPPEPESEPATPTPIPTPTQMLTPPVSPNGRLFTESDEIRLLKIYKKSIKSSSTPFSSSAPITISPHTIRRINKSLHSSNFTQSQIYDKLRRLRLKYRKQARNKSLIKTPHDQRLFNLASKLWGSSKKTTTNSDHEPGETEADNHKEAIANGVGETETDNDAEGIGGVGVVVSELSKYLAVDSVLKEGLKMLGRDKLKEMNERWISLGIEEAMIVAKKADLVKEQTHLLMEVLKSHGNGY